MEKNISLEKLARLSLKCPVCHEAKQSGEYAPIVCWGECWRGKNGLKYTDIDTEKWLKKYSQK
jgi:hypothetical protein